MNNRNTFFSAALALALLWPTLAAAQAVTLVGNIFEGRTPGIYSFKSTNVAKTSGVTLTTVKQDANLQANYGGATVNGRLHCIYANTEFLAFGVLATTDFVYDINTWQLLESTNFQSEYVVATCTAVDPVSGKVYGQFFDNKLEKTIIGIVDYDTYQTTKISDSARRYVAMGMTSKQQLYAIGTDGVLYELSTTDGSERRIGTTGITPGDSPYVQSAAVDSRTDIFYWAHTDSKGSSGVSTVNLSTGATELQTRMQNRACVALLRVEEVSDGAPAAIDDLTVTPVGTTTEATVAFTLPTKTFGGAALTGDVNYEILSGGKTLASGTGAAGTKVSQTVTLAAGEQAVAVSVSNAQGVGKSVAKDTYIGLDTPAAVTNLAVSIDGGQVTVSWDAAEGIHKGHIGDVTYTVTRTPGNVVVAKDITATQVVDAITELRNYIYTVVASNGTATSEPAQSFEIVAGPALSLPYVADFATQEPFNLFTILNPDDDTFFWDYSSEAKALQFNNEFDVGEGTTPNDWAITPPLTLKGSVEYLLKLTAYVGGDYANVGVDQTAITYGRSPSAAEQTGTIAATQSFSNRTAETFAYEFTVPADGDYYIGFHNVSAALRASLFIKSIAISAKDEAGISSVTADRPSSAVYTLSGQRVAGSLGTLSTLRPGVYVSGGRKVVVKR